MQSCLRIFLALAIGCGDSWAEDRETERERERERERESEREGGRHRESDRGRAQENERLGQGVGESEGARVLKTENAPSLFFLLPPLSCTRSFSRVLYLTYLVPLSLSHFLLVSFTFCGLCSPLVVYAELLRRRKH